MKDHFGLRGSFFGYPSIEFLIKVRGYRLLVVPFVLVSEYRRGYRFERLVHFSIFLIKQNSKPKNSTACGHTFSQRLTIRIANQPIDLHNFTYITMNTFCSIIKYSLLKLLCTLTAYVKVTPLDNFDFALIPNFPTPTTFLPSSPPIYYLQR